MLVLVGDHGKDQVPNLVQILTKCSPNLQRPKVLWCYKRDLGFSTHRKKRMKKLKRDKDRGLSSVDSDNNFELFVSQTDITWCYYKDSHRVLGSTVGLLVLQDFEALTPNIMARTIETVHGGGLVVFLLRSVQSLKQLYTMTMDVHSRYRTESAGDVVPRFNERFLLSLTGVKGSKVPACLVCDDELNILPISRKALTTLSGDKAEKKNWTKGDAGEIIVEPTAEENELTELKESLVDSPHVGVLVDLTKTLDQAKALLVFLDACATRESGSLTNKKRTVAMTAARGRGKSATMGLCLAGAVALGFSTITVTAPEPENLVAVFDFVVRGLKALKYQEHQDYRVAYNNATGRDAVKCIMSIHIHSKSHRQVIQYLKPSDIDKFTSAEIVAIDEAAAIPLPIVRKLLTQNSNEERLTFLSSTVNGYEGTGRALSLKLLEELRKKGSTAPQAAAAAANAITGPAHGHKSDAKVHEQRWAAAAEAASSGKHSASLYELQLTTPIRYAVGDTIETWLNKLLCLDSGSNTNLKLKSGAPAPSECELYRVDRDALFSHHTLSEAFLQKLMGLYSSAHYKNTPNDLQLLSDAPAHELFVLLSPHAESDSDSLPDVLAVVQVAMEGQISKKAVKAQLARGHRSAGDLIPWTISQQFGDSSFAQLSGARIVRIAVHPSVQSMGYGSRSMELLYKFYNGEMVSLEAGDDEEEAEDAGENASYDDEEDKEFPIGSGLHQERLKPRKQLPPLLLPLTEVDVPRLDWIGTSFGLTLPLHNFWCRTGMRLLYIRQTKNDLTGEHSVIMVRTLSKRTGFDDAWLSAFGSDFRRRYLSLLSGPFRELDLRLAVSVLESVSPSINDDRACMSGTKINADELNLILSPHDLKRLELYGRNLCDHHLVTDLLSPIARLYFLGRLGDDVSLSSVQSALLCGIGLQNHLVDSLAGELNLPPPQVLAMFNKAMRKLSIVLNTIVEAQEKSEMLVGEKRREAEKKSIDKMRDVARQTLDEDVSDAAKDAMKAFESSLPAEIAGDAELMSYVVKGSHEQWETALKGKEEVGSIQIQSTREKRKIDDEAIEHEADHEARGKKKGGGGKKGKKKSPKGHSNKKLKS